MSSSDNVFKSSSDSSEKKNASSAGADTKKDDPKDPNGSDKNAEHKSEDHTQVCDNKLQKDSWWGGVWKSVSDTVAEGVNYFTSDKAPDQKVDAIKDLTFSDDIFKAKETPKPVTETPTATTSDIGSWFTKMGDAVSTVGKEVTGKVTSAMDWLFSTTDAQGNKTEVSAKDGEAHFKGKSGDGVPVNVDVSREKVTGDVGAARVELDKVTKEGHYKSGTYDVTVKGSTKTVVDAATNQTFEWDEKAQKGFIADKDGKHVFDFTSKDQLTQQLTEHTAITQSQKPADSTADRVRAQMDAGNEQRQTRYIVDKDGNYAVVREDGLMVKTYKNEGYVTIERDGHMFKIQNNQAFIQREDPSTHEKAWVAMRGRHWRLPTGLHVDENTGAVSVDGKTVVTDKGNVQADDATQIDTRTGRMTTKSDTGTVTVDNDNGRTHVRHPGCGDIVNDGHTFVNMDPKTRHTFSSMDSDTGEIRVFGGKNGSGIVLDTKPGGNLTIKEPDGQVTEMNNQGYFNSVDAQGHQLMNVDTSGNVSFYDGTRVSSDGVVSNRYGSASAWDGGASASAAISKADGAVIAALAASSVFDPTGSSLAALDAAGSELSSLAQTYTALGRLDLVGQISSALGQVDAARAKVLQIVSVSRETQRRLGDGGANRVQEALASGSPENYIRNQEQRKSEVA